MRLLEQFNFGLYCFVFFRIMESYGAVESNEQNASAVHQTCDINNLNFLLFAQLLAALVKTQCPAGCKSYPDDTTKPLPEYDFIVVGAGSAGSVVASRLSENPDWQILLLEAGGDPPPLSDIPGLFLGLQGTDIDWGYRTEPDENSCRGSTDGRCRWPRGKVLGGSSVLNAMLYVKGVKHDYDAWASEGNEGWSFDDVLPFFKYSEHLVDTETKFEVGKVGQVIVESLKSDEPFIANLRDAVLEMNLPINDHFSSDVNLGFGYALGTVFNGSRYSTAKAFLSPATDRRNLHVVKFAHVTKVLIEESNKMAYGVEYVKDGKTNVVRTRKEVIVSGGTINTPQILMLSGIGPKEHLKELGLTVLSDLKVGYNLQDHLVYTGLVYSLEKPKEKRPQKDVGFLDNAYQYALRNMGSFSNVGYLGFYGFIKTNVSDDGIEDWPDIQQHHFTYKKNEEDLLYSLWRTTGLSEEIQKGILETIKKHDVIVPLPTLLRPRSRGRVLLNGADPEEKPRIEARYLSDERDVDTLVAGVDFAARMGSTDALRGAGVRVVDLPLAECRHQEPLSPAYWRCALPFLTATLYHPVGTAKMGPASDPDAVVDPQLRVHGVQRLRVADCSVMPTIISGNTNAPAIMIGEKAAHMIAEHWRSG